MINNGKFPINFDQCELNAKVRLDAATLDDISYSGDFNIAATSDFHGQYALMKSLLVNNNIIDKQGNWAFGNGHFVITGDIFDRGDKVTEINVTSPTGIQEINALMNLKLERTLTDKIIEYHKRKNSSV